MSYQLIGFDMSYYSGKLRAYLRCKGIEFTERAPNIFETKSLVRRRIGYFMLPILITDEDETLQDTSFIIAELEKRHPTPAMIPDTPRQKLAALLFELFGDEAMLPPAMHYRWQVGDDNLVRFTTQAGRGLLPWLPVFISRRIANRQAGDAMRAHLPHLDIGADAQPAWTAWTERLCDSFDAHFKQYPYLLGHAPSLGDFGLQGPFYAHLGADPWPKEHLMAPRKHFSAWVARVQTAAGPVSGDWLADDEVPSTLNPLVKQIAEEFMPFLREAAVHMNDWANNNDYQNRWVPRRLPVCEYRLGEAVRKRPALSSHLWKAQRLLDHIDSLDDAERDSVETWLQAADTNLDAFRIPHRPRFEYRNYRAYVSQPGK